jgi:hypothetical protein
MGKGVINYSIDKGSLKKYKIEYKTEGKGAKEKERRSLCPSN